MGEWRWSVLGVSTLTIFTVLASFGPAVARPDPADLCVLHIERAERSERIPRGLLHAIALAETRRWLPDRQQSRPWPWTVTSGEEAYYLPTREAALDKIRQFQAVGRTNIDVGCMQVNLRYHGHAFANPEALLDPATNVAYAAVFLQKLQKETQSWWQAAGYYHSRNPETAAAYLMKVRRFWQDEHAFPTLAASGHQLMLNGGEASTLAGEDRLTIARQDRAVAIQELIQLAEEGDPDAQEKLADLYMHGEKIPQDNVQALKWYMLAALHGKSASALPLREIRARMTPKQIHEAEEKVLFWNPRQLLSLQQPRYADVENFGNENEHERPRSLSAVIQEHLAGLRYVSSSVDSLDESRTYAAIGQYQTETDRAIRRLPPTEELAEPLEAQFSWSITSRPTVPSSAARPAVDANLCSLSNSPARADDLTSGYELYLHGEFDKASKAFLRAAESGNREGQFMLGGLYALGLGLTQNYVEAYKWLSVAAQKGDLLAHRGLEALTFLMSPEQHTEAKKRVFKC